MMAEILDGKAMAAEIRGEVAKEAAEFTAHSGVTPCLAAVLVGDNPASEVYVRNKQKACETAGMKSQLAPASGRHDRNAVARLDRPLEPRSGGTRHPSSIAAAQADRRDPGARGRRSAEGRRCLPSGERGPDRAGPPAVPALHAARHSANARCGTTFPSPGPTWWCWAAAISSASRWRSCSCSAAKGATPR